MQAKGDDRVGFLIVPLIFLPPPFPPSLPHLCASPALRRIHPLSSGRR